MRCSGVLQTFTSDNTLIGGAGFFGGARAGGVWNLIVKDDGPGFIGTLDSWRLTITVQSVLDAPTDLRATVGNQMVSLFWNPPPQQVDSYNIHKDDGSTIQTVSVCKDCTS